MQVRFLQLDDFHVVESREGIQLLPLLLERRKLSFVRQRHLTKVEINRMKGMNADSIVGITIGVLTRLSRVVDRT